MADRECFYCGDPATTRDHLLPRSRGGSDDPINLVDCCRSCNSAKRCRTPGEFVAARQGCRIDAFMPHSSVRPLKNRIADLAGVPRGRAQKDWLRLAQLGGNADG